MAGNRLFSQLAIVFLSISFYPVINSSVIMMTNITCNVDTEICKNNICKLVPIRKGIRFLDFACFFEESQNNLTVRLILNKLGNGGRKIVDSTEDFCKVASREGTAGTMIRMFPSFKKHGTFFSKCPLKGNMTLIRYPLDFSFVPAIIAPGKYCLTGIMRSRVSTKQIPVVHADVYFSVRNLFKNH